MLPIFRSQQQAELLALILADSAAEFTLTELVERTGIPYPSVHREIERALAAGLVTNRTVGRTRVIRADETSPHFVGLSDVLVKAFGAPWILGLELSGVVGINQAFVYGSWAARFLGEPGDRPVGDIDVLVLGDPDRDALYAALGRVEARLGRPVQASIRGQHWLTDGHGSFHDTIADRPLVPIDFTRVDTAPADRSAKRLRHLRVATASSRQVPMLRSPVGAVQPLSGSVRHRALQSLHHLFLDWLGNRARQPNTRLLPTHVSPPGFGTLPG